MISLSKQVWIYIKKKPYVQEAIEQDIINFSALSRKIQHDFGKDLNDLNKDNSDFEAIKAALIRHARKLKKTKQNQEEKVILLLKKSGLNIKNKVAIIHSQAKISNDNIIKNSIAYSKTPNGYIYILNCADAEKFKEENKNTIIDYNLSIILISSSKKIEKIPGVAGFLFGKLASENINILHIIDCREDTLFVVKDYDAPLVFKILSEI